MLHCRSSRCLLFGAFGSLLIVAPVFPQSAAQGGDVFNSNSGAGRGASGGRAPAGNPSGNTQCAEMAKLFEKQWGKDADERQASVDRNMAEMRQQLTGWRGDNPEIRSSIEKHIKEFAAGAERERQQQLQQAQCYRAYFARGCVGRPCRVDDSAPGNEIPAPRPGGTAGRGGSPVPGGRGTGIPAEEILTPGHRNLLFKLGAEMNVIAREEEQKHDPGTEFIGGVAEWARDQIELLAQKPGVPVTQMAEGIIQYFVNDNAANHKALRQAAGEAVKEFRKNPARFLGKNLPNLLPGPGEEISAARAIQQIERVEQTAGKINGLARAEKEFGKAYEGVLDDAARFGAAAPDKCFAANACFPTALAHADLIKTGGPLGNGTPFRITGVNRRGGSIPEDLVHTSQHIEDRLKPYGGNYQPRNPNTFTPDELKQISEGIMVKVDGPDRIRTILEKEGIGSHGLTFVRYDKNSLGHVFNAQNENRAVKFIDHTQPGVDALFTSSLVKEWFYFPIQ